MQSNRPPRRAARMKAGVRVGSDVPSLAHADETSRAHQVVDTGVGSARLARKFTRGQEGELLWLCR